MHGTYIHTVHVRNDMQLEWAAFNYIYSPMKYIERFKTYMHTVRYRLEKNNNLPKVGATEVGIKIAEAKRNKSFQTSSLEFKIVGELYIFFINGKDQLF